MIACDNAIPLIIGVELVGFLNNLQRQAEKYCNSLDTIKLCARDLHWLLLT